MEVDKALEENFEECEKSKERKAKENDAKSEETNGVKPETNGVKSEETNGDAMETDDKDVDVKSDSLIPFNTQPHLPPNLFKENSWNREDFWPKYFLY